MVSVPLDTSPHEVGGQTPASMEASILDFP